MSPVDVDALYAAFVDTLPKALQAAGKSLAYDLKLTNRVDVPWSEVFGQEIVLSAPGLFTDALPNSPPAAVRDAVLVHMLNMLEAFATERLADPELGEPTQIGSILPLLGEARQRVMARLGSGFEAAFAVAQARTRSAFEQQSRFLSEAKRVTLEEYVAISLAKQNVACSATLALARATGASEGRILAIERTLSSAWLGMQFESDVLDWEEDWRRGGAWAVCVARGMQARGQGSERPTKPDMLRQAVLASGALAQMLGESRRSFRRTWRRARALRVERLAAWAEQREQHVLLLVSHESQSAGYAVRVQKLAPWAAKVLR